MADYFAPQAPSVTNSTAMANNAIMEGFTSAKHTYMKAQERIYQEVMTNFENAANAESLVAKNVGRKGWDELNMSLNDQYLNAINEIKKQQKLKPFDVELKNKLSTLQSKFQQTLSSIAQTNQMFDNFSKLQAEGKLDSRLMTRGSNSFKQFLEDVDNGILSVDVNGTITNSKTGESGTFSEIIGGAIPESIYKIDEIDEMTSQLRRLRASDPEMKKIINEDGRIITKQSMTPSQKRKIDLYIKHSIFNNEGGLSQIGEIFEIQRQGAFAGVNNGAKAEELDGQGLVDYVKQFFVSDEEITGIAPQKEETADKEKPLTGVALKQYNFDETAGDIAKGNVEKLATMKKSGRSYGSTIIDGYEYADGIIIDDASFVPSKGDYTKVRLAYKNPKGEETEKPKIKTYDLNNDADRGEFFAILANMDEFRGAVPAKMPIEQKVRLTEMQREYPTTFADQVAESTIAKIGGTGEKLKNSAIKKIASDLTNELSDYGVTVDTGGAGYNGVTLRGQDNTIAVKNIHTEKGKEELRKAIKEILGESDTKQPEVRVEIPNNVNKEMMVLFKGKPRKVSEIWGELSDAQKQAIIDNSK